MAADIRALEERFRQHADDPQELTELVQAWRSDPRRGVQRLVARWEAELAVWHSQLQAYEARWAVERRHWGQGRALLAGVDEAGRGPLAGPVVAAAVILPREARLVGLNDSKQLTPARRQALVPEIKRVAVAWAIGEATVDEIDVLNIHAASFLAMRRAILALAVTPDLCLVDGFAIPALHLPQEAIVGGDASSNSIAAASVLAKEHRDALMRQYDREFPGYGFGEHKGYPTRSHREALARLGPTPWHRKSFRWQGPP